MTTKLSEDDRILSLWVLSVLAGEVRRFTFWSTAEISKSKRQSTGVPVRIFVETSTENVCICTVCRVSKIYYVATAGGCLQVKYSTVMSMRWSPLRTVMSMPRMRTVFEQGDKIFRITIIPRVQLSLIVSSRFGWPMREE
jgi:hypothetical protein